MKRSLDLCVSVGCLLVLSPVALIIAILIKCTSPGPVLFRQRRVGRHGHVFTILKFRSMRTGGGGAEKLITVFNDPRVTAAGAILRATKLDELPQLVNVVRGEMSLVGPRPEVPEYVEKWEPARRDIILSIRPGITDPASIELRRESELLAEQDDPAKYYEEILIPAKTARYVEYVNARTFLGDLHVIAATLKAVIWG